MRKTARQVEVIRALEKIGFERIGGAKELKYRYTHTNGVIAKTVSVPKRREEIRKGTLHSIRRQTGLDLHSFDGAIVCPFRLRDYQEFIDRNRLAE